MWSLMVPSKWEEEDGGRLCGRGGSALGFRGWRERHLGIGVSELKMTPDASLRLVLYAVMVDARIAERLRVVVPLRVLLNNGTAV